MLPGKVRGQLRFEHKITKRTKKTLCDICLLLLAFGEKLNVVYVDNWPVDPGVTDES